MTKTMSKAATQRLITSDFYHEVYATVKAWDYYLRTDDKEAADEMMHKWTMAKLALKFITGKSYGFMRDNKSFSLVNEADYTDILFREQPFTLE